MDSSARVCRTDECKKENMSLGIASLFFFFFFFPHILNKRTMSSKRLMGCGNSLENTNGAAEQ